MTAAGIATHRVRPIGAGVAVAAVGFVISGVGVVVDPRQAYASWLAAFAAGLSTTLGALMLVAITHVTGARWFDPLRRAALDVAATLPLFALLFVPLLFGLHQLYPWAVIRQPERAGYLNVPFFAARAAVYFGIWTVTATRLRRLAVSRSRDAALPPSPAERAVAAVSLPALGLSLTFAAFDWLMSLAPGWVSTVFGVYWFAGGFLAALALVAVLARPAESRAAPDPRVRDRAYALGTLMLTFVIFWAYIAYCQYFITWIADVPAEVAWYVPRLRGGWGDLAAVLLVGHFAVPTLLLLFHAAKVNGRLLALTGAWLLVMHYVDTYWLVLPQLHPDAVHPHWLDLSALAAVGGTMYAWSDWLRRR